MLWIARGNEADPASPGYPVLELLALALVGLAIAT